MKLRQTGILILFLMIGSLVQADTYDVLGSGAERMGTLAGTMLAVTLCWETSVTAK